MEEKLSQIFQSVFSKPSLQIHRDMSAKDVDSWNSLTHIEMLSQVEDAFSIKFSLKDVKKFKNVGDMMDAIERLSKN